MDPRELTTDINKAMQFETREEAEAYAREHGLTNVAVIQVAEDPETGNLQRTQ